MRLFSALVAALALGLGLAWAQADGPRLTDYGDILWKAPASLPPGAEYHLMREDPKTGAVETLVRFPSGYALDIHRHAHEEVILVLRGKLEVGLGGRTEVLKKGAYAVFPPGTAHSLKARGWGKTVLMVSMSGPYGIEPAGDL